MSAFPPPERLHDDHGVPDDMPPDPGVSYRGIPPSNFETLCGSEILAEDALATELHPDSPAGSDGGRGHLAETVSKPVRIHHRYTTHEILGVGAQGEVWRATQESLHRNVAVKLLRASLSPLNEDNPLEEIRRIEHFRQEALVAASLEHPNILPVHDLVTDTTGRPMLVMKQVRGKPWPEILSREPSGPDPDFLGRHIPILMSVAQAVAFAHSRNVIHRDLKPSQVLIGEFGEVVLTDWGLAVVLEDDRDPSASTPLNRRGIRGYAGNPAGTPAYMAPEQTVPGLDGIGPWTDVFLLGGILYFLLTGTPPYVTAHSRAAFLMARESEIEPPEVRAPNPGIPAELSRLAMQALARDPEKRISSASAFHAALQDYLSGAGRRRESLALTGDVQKHCSEKSGYAELASSQAALARAEGLWPANPQLPWLRQELTTLFATLALKNNDLVLARIQAGMLSDESQRSALLTRVEATEQRRIKTARERRMALRALGCLIILFLLGIGQYIRVEVRARGDAEAARLRTEQARRQTLTERNQARHEQYYSGIGFADAYARDKRFNKAFETLLEHVPADLRQWEWGHLLARISSDDMILHRASGSGNDIFRGEFSPDGERIVTGQRNGQLTVWDARRGRRLYTLHLPFRRIWVTRYSPDGRHILVTSFDGKASILDADTGTTSLPLECENCPPRMILRGGGFSPDGQQVAVASSDKLVRLWDSRTGKLLRTIRFEQIPYDVTFTPDGTALAVTTVANGQAYLCDAQTGAILQTYAGHTDSAYSVAVSSDGQSVMTTCRDRQVRIFDRETGALRRSISTPGNSRPNSAVFSPDGSRIAFTCESGECMLYEAATGRHLGSAQAAPEMYYAAFHPGANKLLTTSLSEVRLWDLERILSSSAREVAQLPEGTVPDQIRQISFPLDREIAWVGRDTAWKTSASAVLFQTPRGTYAVAPYNVVSSPDGRQQIRLADDSTTHARLRKAGWKQSKLWKGGGQIFNAAFSASGRLAATGSYLGNVKIWNTATWREAGILHGPGGAAWTLDFSPDETLLAVGFQSGEVVVWDVAARRPRFTIRAHPRDVPVVMVRFSPDGRLLLTSSSDRSARLWDANTGSLLTTLSGHNKGLLAGIFSPDGQRILTASFDNTVKLWDTHTGRELLTVFRVPNSTELMGIGFSRDGRRAFFTTDKRELFETEILPWQDTEFPGSSDTPFQHRLELWKRQNRLDPTCTLDEIVWQ